jgi:hypothetical protein
MAAAIKKTEQLRGTNLHNRKNSILELTLFSNTKHSKIYGNFMLINHIYYSRKSVLLM